jgi:hypothetical protein
MRTSHSLVIGALLLSTRVAYADPIGSCKVVKYLDQVCMGNPMCGLLQKQLDHMKCKPKTTELMAAVPEPATPTTPAEAPPARPAPQQGQDLSARKMRPAGSERGWKCAPPKIGNIMDCKFLGP